MTIALSRTLKLVVSVIIIVVVLTSVYAAFTYPRTVVSFPVSFTVGAQTKTEAFDVPWLHGLVQVEIKIQTGTELWSADITSENERLWSHAAAQGGQTTYSSE